MCACVWWGEVSQLIKEYISICLFYWALPLFLFLPHSLLYWTREIKSSKKIFYCLILTMLFTNSVEKKIYLKIKRMEWWLFVLLLFFWKKWSKKNMKNRPKIRFFSLIYNRLKTCYQSSGGGKNRTHTTNENKRIRRSGGEKREKKYYNC